MKLALLCCSMVLVVVAFAVFGGVNVVMYVVLLCLGFNFYALVFANEF